MLFRKVRRRFHKLKQLYTDQQINEQQVLLSLDLDENLQVLRSIYQDCFDVVFRTFFNRWTNKSRPYLYRGFI